MGKNRSDGVFVIKNRPRRMTSERRAVNEEKAHEELESIFKKISYGLCDGSCPFSQRCSYFGKDHSCSAPAEVLTGFNASIERL